MSSAAFNTLSMSLIADYRFRPFFFFPDSVNSGKVLLVCMVNPFTPSTQALLFFGGFVKPSVAW